MDRKDWTTEDIPNLTGKLIIVTGSNSGLGFESVKVFSARGARVVMACRDLQKANEAKEAILEDTQATNIDVIKLDLADLDSIREFSSSFKGKYDRLDVLLNNAGIMATPFGKTRNGFESQIGTNHLGHFALTGLLIDMILNTPGSRVVNVSSNAHKFGKMDFNNLLFENGKGYSPFKAYGRSKLANLLFTYELQRRFDKKNTDSTALAAHPGTARTNLERYLEKRIMYRLFRPLFNFLTQSAAMGALPEIRASVDPNAKGGQYYGPGGSFEMTGHPVEVKSSRASHDPEVAKKLWEVSEQLTGIKIDI